MISLNMAVFINGDSQYGKDRVEALLLQEGFVDANGNRLRKEDTLIHVGDCGDYYEDNKLRDEETWEYIKDLYDHIIYGNHDYAILDESIAFGGFDTPTQRTKELIHEAVNNGTMKFAVAAGGFLITHAGVHPLFEHLLSDDPAEASEQINNIDKDSPLIKAIGPGRYGPDRCGGILWRDISELISDKWPQIHGHSRCEEVTKYTQGSDVEHVCVDIGYPSNGKLAGIYVETLEVASVDIRWDEYMKNKEN